MPQRNTSPRRASRTLMPLIVVVGPLLSALTLTALGYVMFRSQAAAGAPGPGLASTFSGPLEYTVILALAGALVTLLVAMLGLALYGRERKGEEARRQALAEGIDRVAELERITRRIAERGERREAAASTWARRQREALSQLGAMTGARATLQRIAGDIWAGVSQPGASLDTQTALRMARESAVASAALGAALDDLRSLMASSPAEVDAIEAIDDALVEDLIALEELARQTHQALNWTTGEIPASMVKKIPEREVVSAPSFNAPSATNGRPAVNVAERAPEALHADPRMSDSVSAYPPFERPRPPMRGEDDSWPPPVNDRSTGQGKRLPKMRPEGSAGLWHGQPKDTGKPNEHDTGKRRPGSRDRDDSSSRWLND
jgi:membrane protein implicated in regulation of membrane protease activity